jgi:hypothetical protein
VPAGFTGAALLAAGVGTAFVLENPVTKPIGHPYWVVETFPPRPNVAAFRDAAALVRPEDSVVATMALAPHLARREELGIVGWPATLRHPTVLLLDVTDFRWFGGDPTYLSLLAGLVQAPGFGVLFYKDGIAVLRSGESGLVDRSIVLSALRSAQPTS